VYFIDGQVNLVALNRVDGTLRWTRALHDAKIAGRPVPENPTFNHRTAVPLLHDGVLFAGSSDGGLYAVAPATGSILWRHEARAPIFSGIGLNGPDTLMFGTMDGSVVCLDRRDQREVLRIRTGAGVVTTPVVAGGRLIVGSRDYLLYGFNAADGSLAWKFSYWFSWVESTPVVSDGIAYVGASDYSRVTALDPGTGRAHWAAEVHGMNWGSPLVTAQRVFTGTVAQNIPGTAIAHVGGIVALDRATGAVLWRWPAALAPEGQFGGYAGTLAIAGDKVIAAGFDGNLIALPAE
jgi:outer membrane protein assembly factor BamB